MPEEKDAEAKADHQGLRSESRGYHLQRSVTPPSQQEEKRLVECDTRISRSRRPIAVEGTNRVMILSTPSPTSSPRGIAFSDYE